MTKKSDLNGLQFGKLTVLELSGSEKKHSLWKCICACGNITYQTNRSLKSGVVSCGCAKHKFTGTRFHKIWLKMVERCEKQYCQQYKFYGGRGIKVCEKWKTFLGFKEDMYESYLKHVDAYGEKQTTLDRVNTNGNYSLDNCQWATIKEQCRNRRSNKFIEYKGYRLTIVEMSEKFNISYNLLAERIRKGWDVKRAIEQPKRGVK